MRLIQASFRTKGLSLEAIARAVRVSPGHLSKTFRRETGRSVIAFIHEQRVMHAAHLLRTTPLSVKAIAEECGYHGSSELHRHFCRVNGASPLGFRSRQSKRITALDNTSLF
jgi:transcriptional regulator GlxA family with amidase domain